MESCSVYALLRRRTYHLIALAPEVYSIDYVPFAPALIDGILVAWSNGYLVCPLRFIPLVRGPHPAREALRYE